MAQPLPTTDEHSDEDTLVGGTRAAPAGLRLSPELTALLRPTPGSLIPAMGRPLGLGACRVTSETSVSDAVIEDRG